MAKDGNIRFLCNCEWSKTLCKLPDDVRLKVYDAMFAFAEMGAYEELDFIGEIAFEPIKNEIQRYLANYNETCEKRRKSIEKRWADTNVYKCIQMNTNVSDGIQLYTNVGNPNPNPNPNPSPNSKEKIYKKESAASEPLPHSQQEKRFIAPSLEEVREYMQGYVSSKAKQGIHYDFKDEWAEDYCDFYGSKGWMVGSNKMKDWRLAASKWVRSQSAAITTNITHNNYPKIDNNHFEGEYNPHIYDNEEENWL